MFQRWAAPVTSSRGSHKAPWTRPSIRRLAPCLADRDRRCQGLALDRGRLDLLDHVHALDHAAEGGEALAVGVALAAEIQLGLVANANKKVRRGRVRSVA